MSFLSKLLHPIRYARYKAGGHVPTKQVEELDPVMALVTLLAHRIVASVMTNEAPKDKWSERKLETTTTWAHAASQVSLRIVDLEEYRSSGQVFTRGKVELKVKGTKMALPKDADNVLREACLKARKLLFDKAMAETLYETRMTALDTIQAIMLADAPPAPELLTPMPELLTPMPELCTCESVLCLEHD